MARKKPISGKARKEKLQLHRQLKRDTQTPVLHPLDAQQLEEANQSNPLNFSSSRSTSVISGHPRLGLKNAPATASTRTSTTSRSIGTRYRTAEEQARDSTRAGRVKLESRFLKLPLDLIEHYRKVSATEPLQRPIPSYRGVLNTQDFQPSELDAEDRLRCPQRPKWRYTMTKKEVEKNEGVMFEKWLQETDALLTKFAQIMPGGPLRTAPSYFERNLEVFRQLWRVSEVSSILLVLVDVRFPLLHYPPALQDYLSALRPKKKLIIVLTKTDLVPPSLAEAWARWFEEREGPNGASVVLMESYRQTERLETTQGTSARFVPAAPTQKRLDLLSALKEAHQELLEPPAILKSAGYQEKLKYWRPRVRRKIDWESIEEEKDFKKETSSSKGILGGKKARRNKDKDLFVQRENAPPREDAADEPEIASAEEAENEPSEKFEPIDPDEEEFPFLTIGLIGSPNVGKSSLLNALLGKSVVRASRTPGKTKSLQTIFWNKTIRLCDCPGLVCPSFAGMERQVLAGIIPIQNVEPVLYFVGQRLPLEKVLQLKHVQDYDETAFPDLDEDDENSISGPKWTADELLADYAVAQGFITAKAGRPDLYRAGSKILRSLHSSAIPWAFRPPFAGDAADEGNQEGIWLKAFVPQADTGHDEQHQAEESEQDLETAEESDENSAEETEAETSDENSEAADAQAVKAVQSVFAALEIEGGESDEDDKGEAE